MSCLPNQFSFPIKYGGGGGCDIAGAPVQLGTAMANILIPLVPAFAIGYRIIRRRRRKEGK